MSLSVVRCTMYIVRVVGLLFLLYVFYKMQYLIPYYSEVSSYNPAGG